MASKHAAWCPGCNDKDTGEDSSPCMHCGYPSFWPHPYPNCYTAAPKPTVEQVMEEHITDEVMEEMDSIVASYDGTDEYVVPKVQADEGVYYCTECGSRHKSSSKIGKSHLKYQE